MKPHPAAEMFPLMTGDDLRELADDIKQNGLLEPIITHDGMILDGRNRYAACGMVAVPPRMIAWDGKPGSPTLYVVAKNLHRRHLTLAQQSSIGVLMLPLLQEEAKKRQATSTGGAHPQLQVKLPEAVKGQSREIAAKAVGVSPSTIQRAKVVKDENPKGFARLQRGESTVNQEYRKVRQENPRPSTATGKRLSVLQSAHKQRMIDVLSNISGACSGLETHVNVDLLRQACQEEELTEWSTKAAKCSAILRRFSHRLKGEANGE